MAIEHTDKTDGQLERTWSGVAAAVSLLAALAGIVLLIVRLTGGAADFGQGVYAGIWVVLLALVAVLAVQMLRGAAWAPLAMLLFWAMLLGGAMVLALCAAIWGAPEWFAKAYPVHPAAILVPVIAIAGGCLTLLMLASAADSRLRYGSMVTMTSAGAVAVAIIVLMVTQMDYVSVNLESTGQASITGATRRAVTELPQVAGKVRLSCLYASSDKKKRSDDYRGDTWDLLQELAEVNPKAVAVENVTTDAGKARTMERIRRALGSMNAERTQLLDETKRSLPELIAAVEATQKGWEGMPAESYVFNWGRGAAIRDGLGQVVQALGEMQDKLKSQPFDKAMEDSAPLVEQTQEMVKQLRDLASGSEEWLKGVAAVAEGAAQHRGEVLQSVAQAVAAVKAARAALPAGTVTPDQARAGLTNFAGEIRKASDALIKAGEILDNLGGEANQSVVADCRLLMLSVQGMGIRIGEWCRKFQGPAFAEMADSALEFAKAPKAELPAQAVAELQAIMARTEPQMTSLASGLEKQLDKLASPTPEDKAFLASAAKGGIFHALAKPLGELEARSKALPEQKGRGVIDRLKEDNIVIIEAGDKVDVVGFDEVWPQSSDETSPNRDQAQERSRVFDGDAAVRSHLIRLGHKEPFATILLAYFEPKVSPEARQMGQGNPPDDISVTNSYRSQKGDDLSKLSERLELANFEVKKWNLTDPMPDEAAKPAVGSKPATIPTPRPKILLVLPALRQGPTSFGPMQERMLKEKIDSGIPAIFLTHFVQPRGPMMNCPPLAMGEYLRSEWGVKVMSDWRILSALPDPNRPGQFQLTVALYRYLSGVDFAGNDVISKPLRGLRTLWQDLCPLMPKSTVLAETAIELRATPAQDEARRGELQARLGRLAKLEQTPLMTVPAARGVWATRDLMALFQQFERQAGRIAPGGESDVSGPFTTAISVVRKEDAEKKIPAGQIVVVSTALSLVDAYLAQPVWQIGEGGAVQPEAPPRVNAELIVNSAYRLAGLTGWISESTRTEPMRAFESPSGATWLWLLCVLGLPAAVLAAGGVVLYARSR
ncbi:MAG: hypothetical protein NT031_09880 [Planctomycetota bacterium]|nr:hypothetical protein [Planctomycetota bacterium]